MLVDFMIIGAQKAGTTSLAAQLAQHPAICFSREKEPGHFSKESDWRVGLDEYHALFDARPGQLCGEASTMYTFMPESLETPRRLHEYNPALKLVYVMRHPVDRIVSHYSFRDVRGRTRGEPADDEVFADPTYVNRSRYAVQVAPYIELFGRAQVLLLVFEEYIRAQRETLEQIATFLGIDPEPCNAIDLTPKNVTAGTVKLGTRGRRLRDSGVVRAVRPLVPTAARRWVRERMSRHIERNVTLSARTQQGLWRLLESDVRAITALMGRQDAVWQPPAG